jgi:hypothetical protein
VVVLALEGGEEVAIRRVLGRRVDPESGRVYHLELDPPPANNPGLADRLQVWFCRCCHCCWYHSCCCCCCCCCCCQQASSLAFTKRILGSRQHEAINYRNTLRRLWFVGRHYPCSSMSSSISAWCVPADAFCCSHDITGVLRTCGMSR